MQDSRRNEIALKYVQWLMYIPVPLASLEPSEESYGFFDAHGVDRSELHSFLNANQMARLGLRLDFTPDRAAEIAWAVMLFESRQCKDDRDARADQPLVKAFAASAGIAATDLAQFLNELRTASMALEVA
jgi:hypothetical protein